MKKNTKQKNHLKRNAACTLLLCTVLTCAACGTGTADTPDAEASHGTEADASETPPSQDTETGIQAQPDAAQNDTAGPGTGNSAPEISSSGNPETDTTVSTFPSNIHIEIKTEEEEKTADDGTVYFTRSFTYPVVTIEGNDDAAGKINADIRSRIDAFKAGTEIEEWAKEGYDETISSDSEYPFISYIEDLGIAPARSDSNVISFTVSCYTFTGGAHGNYDTHGVNYNAKTGDVIAFADLSDDPDAFHEDTLAYNQNLAKTKAYQDRMFNSEYTNLYGSDNELETVLYADDVWYLSTSGLVFMSAPYALGPYASGTIEFLIPYSDLAGMGLKDSYSYTDRLIMKLQENENFSFDLNGDGHEDSFLFFQENTENADGTYGALLHLTVNDTDFSQNGNDAVKECLSDFSWDEYFLYDMNVDDDYTELAVLAGVNEGNEFVYYSHFFRYTGDGDLVYLGKSKGDLNDPTVEITIVK